MDRTPFEAIKAIERKERPHFDYHPMVYICSPYAGNIEENVYNARRYSRFAVEKGYLPITPHLLYPQLEMPVYSGRVAGGLGRNPATLQ